MAVVRADGNRSVRRLVLMLVAIVAAIGLVWNSSRRARHRSPAPPPVAEQAAAAAPVPDVAPAAPPAAEAAPAVAAPAAVETERPELSARRQSEIARVVTDGQAGLKVCYERALHRDATLVNGSLTVHVSVAPSGRVDRVSVTGPAEFRAALRPCLDAAVSRWAFPTAPAPYETKFPLALRAAQ